MKKISTLALALASACMPDDARECTPEEAKYVELAALAPGLADLSDAPFVCSDKERYFVARADLQSGLIIFHPPFFGESYKRYEKNAFYFPYTYFGNVHRADVCRVAYDGLVSPQGSPWEYDDTILSSAVTMAHEHSHLAWGLGHSESYEEAQSALYNCKDAGRLCDEQEEAFEAELELDPFYRADEALKRRLIQGGMPTIDMAQNVSEKWFDSCFFPQLTDLQAKWARGELSDEKYEPMLDIARKDCAELAMGICDSTVQWY